MTHEVSLLNKPYKKPLFIVLITMLLLLIVLTLGYFAYYTYSRSIDVTIQGVNFQLGPENSRNVESESVHLKGKWSRKLNGLRIFKGTVTFAHHDNSLPQENLETTIYFDRKGYGPIFYSTMNSYVYSDGVLFANSDFSSVSFLRMRKVVSNGSIDSGWNGNDGLMFAGPAATREQALRISNELMKKFLTRSGNPDDLFVLK